MRVQPTPQFEVDIDDVAFVEHETVPFLARVMLPRGAGPFPALVSVHGGAWYENDRTHRNVTKRHLARHGIAVIAIDFRMPPDAAYPAAVADINFAIRWVKANAERLRTSPEAVGIQGESSGGHLAVLAAVRPYDPRYCTIPNRPGWPAVDATVAWVISFWPVISPFGRYRYAKDLLSRGELPRMTDLVLPGHEQFWVTEDAMSEGDPVLALERGEQLELPPVLCFQGPNDLGHPIAHLQHFVELYRQVGGSIDLGLLHVPEGGNLGFTMEEDPNGTVSSDVMARIAEFINKCTSP